jgi:hypothetical protein
MILLAEIQIYKNPLAEFNFLGSQTSLTAQIQASRPQTYDERTSRVDAHWHFSTVSIMSSEVAKSRVSLINTELQNSYQFDS